MSISSIARPDQDEEEEPLELEEEEESKPLEPTRKSQTAPPPPPNQVVFHSVQQWFTQKSLQWIKGELAEVPPQPEDKPAVKSLEDQLERLKIQAFMAGQTEFSIEDIQEKKTTEENDDEGRAIVLPLVDVSSQKALRKRILMDYLEKGFTKLVPKTRLPFRRVQHDLNALVSTFNLTPDSITFRPGEIPPLCLTLLAM